MTFTKKALGAGAVLATAAALMATAGYATAAANAKPKLYSITTFAQAPAYEYDEHDRWRSIYGGLRKGTHFVYCKIKRPTPYRGPQGYNHYYILTELDFPAGKLAYVPAYFLANWGNDQAKLDNGRVIPDC